MLNSLGQEEREGRKGERKGSSATMPSCRYNVPLIPWGRGKDRGREVSSSKDKATMNAVF